MNAIKRIFGIALKYHKKRLMIGYLTVLGAAASGLGIPLVIRSAVDDALSSENATRALLNIGIILILLGLCRGLFAWLQTTIAEGLSQKIAYRIRNE